jgi:hypothetical protein
MHSESDATKCTSWKATSSSQCGGSRNDSRFLNSQLVYLIRRVAHFAEDATDGALREVATIWTSDSAHHALEYVSHVSREIVTGFPYASGPHTKKSIRLGVSS